MIHFRIRLQQREEMTVAVQKCGGHRRTLILLSLFFLTGFPPTEIGDPPMRLSPGPHEKRDRSFPWLIHCSSEGNRKLARDTQIFLVTSCPAVARSVRRSLGKSPRQCVIAGEVDAETPEPFVQLGIVRI